MRVPYVSLPICCNSLYCVWHCTVFKITNLDLPRYIHFYKALLLVLTQCKCIRVCFFKTEINSQNAKLNAISKNKLKKKLHLVFNDEESSLGGRTIWSSFCTVRIAALAGPPGVAAPHQTCLSLDPFMYLKNIYCIIYHFNQNEPRTI